MEFFNKISSFFEKKLEKNEQVEMQVIESATAQTTLLSLLEQIELMNVADLYIEEYEKSKVSIDPGWEKGFSMQCEMINTDQEHQLYRSNVEVFYQVPQSLEKKCSYLVSLVKFPEDSWRVLQVKYSDSLLDS